MKKLLLSLVLLFALAIFVSACNNSTVVEDSFVCESPYIQVGSDCCLDQNDNGICDSDEPEEEAVNGAPAPEESEEIEEVLSGCEDTDFEFTNLCAQSFSVINYAIKVGDVPIDSFELELFRDAPDGDGEVSVFHTIQGADAGEDIFGSVSVNRGLYSMAILRDNSCNIEKEFGPGFPNVLGPC